MVKEFKEPTVRQKLNIRREFEKLDMEQLAGNTKLIPTDLAIVILQSCYGTPENKFFDFSEVEIAKMVSGAIVKLFFTNNLDKKK
ncbi:MAG TPA: hypothetical protein VIH28_09605 [Ignavibacteriaceae bacterium]